ncbi:MAG: putative glycolipid-binding domain-containing protein, partial [Actinomycetota bacterium]
RRQLDLHRDADGRWQVEVSAEGDENAGGMPPPGGDPAGFAAALDCDLGLSPLTNTMPVRRHGLLAGGGPEEFLMAWVSVPDLSVQPSVQTYTHLSRDEGTGQSVIRFASDGFQADIVFGADGFVADYPGIGRRP